MSACSLGLTSPFFPFSFPILFLEVGTLTSILLAIQHTFSSLGLLTIHIDGGFATYKAAPKFIFSALPHVLQAPPPLPLFVLIFSLLVLCECQEEDRG